MFEETHDDDLALFQLPEFETGTQKTDWITYNPINQLTAGSAIEFTVPGTSISYIDLRRTLLSLKLKIVKNDGTDIVQGDKVGLVNAPLHSVFSQVDFNVQQQPTTETGTNYPYKAYLDLLLDSTDQHELNGQCFNMDTSGSVDVTDPSGTNSGLFDRAAFTKEGGVLDVIGRLHVDVCQQDRFLLNGVPLNIKLWQSTDPFRLSADKSDEAYRVKILEASLRVAMVKVNPGVIIGHAEALKTSETLYPYTRSVIKTYAVPSGQYSFTADDLFQGEVPKRLIVGLVSSSATHGSYVKNPFNFHHYNCNYAGFFVNSQSTPSHPLQPNYEGNQFIEAYHRLTSCHINRAVTLSRKDFKSGSSLYVFDPDGDYKDRVNERAHTRLELKFAKPLPEACTVIVYAKFAALMKIDSSRNVFLE